MSMDASLSVAGEQLVLMPERSLYWPQRATLIVADLHWGKATAFQAAAIPLPEGHTQADLKRLEAALNRTGASRLLILGDLLHAQASREPGLFAAITAWRSRRPTLEIVLVRGNHDRHAGDPPPEWNFQTVEQPLVEPPFHFCHEPCPVKDAYNLAGHLHPAVALGGQAQQRVRLPCFSFGAHCGLLPAFGSFTGSFLLHPRKSDRIFVIAEGQVLEV